MTDKAYSVQRWLNRGYDLSIKLEAKKTHLLAKEAGGRYTNSGLQKMKPDGNREEIKECEKISKTSSIPLRIREYISN